MSVEERLEHLERQNQWMRRLGAVGVALVAAVFLMGQGKDVKTLYADTIETKKLVILDRHGKERAELGVMRIGRKRPHSAASLWFKDKQGARTMHLLGGAAPALILERPESHVGLSIGVFGSPSLSWGRGRMGSLSGRILSVTMVNDDYPEMTFYNKADKVIWQAPKE